MLKLYEFLIVEVIIFFIVFLLLMWIGIFMVILYVDVVGL